jgi:hypothetical protein
VITLPDIPLSRYFDMKSFIAITVLLISSGASACELSLVTPARSDLKNPVQANLSLADDILTAGFSVSAPSLNAKKTLARTNILTNLTSWNCS